MRTVKHVFIEAMFPELKGPMIYKSAHGEAGSVKPAISRAFGNLLKQARGKRISTIKATIVISTKEVEDNETEHAANPVQSGPVATTGRKAKGAAACKTQPE